MTTQHIEGSAGTIYSRPSYESIDVGAQMRLGHPDVAEGDRIILDMLMEMSRTAEGPLRILELGSGSGYLVEMIRRQIPNARLVANEVEPALVKLARERFAGTDVRVFDGDFEDWTEPLDVLISWGAHHHFSSRTHLDHARRLLGRDGKLILGDEFCPDYLETSDRARLAAAELIYLAQGHLLTTHAEVDAFEKTGDLPAWTVALEKRRRGALWHWYKYVVDYALERDDDVVIQAELQIAADDLRTEFAGEHKIALPIVVRELELNGFRELQRHSLRAEPDLASFFVLELGVDPRSVA